AADRRPAVFARGKRCGGARARAADSQLEDRAWMGRRVLAGRRGVGRSGQSRDGSAGRTDHASPLWLHQYPHDGIPEGARRLSTMRTVDEQLFEAARTGDVETLTTLLDEHPDKVQVRAKPYEWTLLHAAAQNGHLA